MASQIFAFTYIDLAELVGVSINAVHQHKTRQLFDPSDLRSIILYLAGFGSPELKREMFERMIRQHSQESKRATAAKRRGKKRVAKKRPARRSTRVRVE